MWVVDYIYTLDKVILKLNKNKDVCLCNGAHLNIDTLSAVTRLFNNAKCHLFVYGNAAKCHNTICFKLPL